MSLPDAASSFQSNPCMFGKGTSKIFWKGVGGQEKGECPLQTMLNAISNKLKNLKRWNSVLNYFCYRAMPFSTESFFDS